MTHLVIHMIVVFSATHVIYMWHTCDTEIRSHLCETHCHIPPLWHIWWYTLLVSLCDTHLSRSTFMHIYWYTYLSCLLFVLHMCYTCDTHVIHIRSYLLWHTLVMFQLLYDTSVTHICHKLYDTHLIQILSHGSSLWHAHDTHMYHVIPLWHTCYKHVIIHLVTCIWYINNILYHCDANMSYLTIVITMIHAHYHLSYTTKHMWNKHICHPSNTHVYLCDKHAANPHAMCHIFDTHVINTIINTPVMFHPCDTHVTNTHIMFHPCDMHMIHTHTSCYTFVTHTYR